MKQTNINRSTRRIIRHARITKKLRLIDNHRPVLIVVKSNLHISVQVWDYKTNKIIVASSSKQLKLKNGNKENARTVGSDIANKLMAKNIIEVAFDTGGSKYHGRIAALADAARAVGLKF